MTELAIENVVAQTVALLTSYEFELKGYGAGELVSEWLHEYPASWLRLAVIEALYQGRYKVVSVEQILRSWLRRGNPKFHFNHEFESLICSKLPRSLATFENTTMLGSFSVDIMEYEYKTFVPFTIHPSSSFPMGETSPLSTEEWEKSSPASETDNTNNPNLKAETTDKQEKEAHPPVSPDLLEKKHHDLDQGKEETLTSPELMKKLTELAAEKETPLSDEQNKSLSASFISPIHQLTPRADPSQFYSRLKTVAHQSCCQKGKLKN
ncbi:MAG: hypothetical protein DSM107014_10670 [Gomphosphaeria aponina SAG 52.96 = DSM 107014]|uniref:Uncharacterized protein n=1 Tax=Gomphosphaeria aponina SAG 52.96 = DSM 107014 TaxID=1521640 RepID=A0A941JSF7_9CHRO|nr:hypothetical protein [Gomphosphaeria aponina SAG 52.96 = DSM 107014]